jgi:hypothetical protein
MMKTRSLASAAVLAVATLAPAAASAQADGGWHGNAIIYGYFPSVGGSTAFPNEGSPVSIDADKIIGDLKFAFMGSLQIEKGRWGLFNDVMYLDIGGSKSGSRDISIGGSQIPAGTSANLNLDLRGWVWTVAGTYQVSADPAAPMQVLLGARLLDVEENFDWQTSGNIGSIPLPGRQGNVRDKASNWDAIVGVKGRLAFGTNREWFIPYYADVGGGDSDLTWQAIAGIGYSWKWGDLIAAWRYLDYDLKSGSAIHDVNFNGPAVGVSFRW